LSNEFHAQATAEWGKDGRTYETAVEASSLFDAAARALEQWSRLWYRRNGFVEVRMGDKC
jgi:hypothetical protein